MREALADVFIAALELLEAEARSARRGLLRAAGGVVLLAAAAVLALGATAVLAWALLTALYPVMAAPLARLLTGIATLALAGGALWIAARLNR
jgi:hypothetical protein